MKYNLKDTIEMYERGDKMKFLFFWGHKKMKPRYLLALVLTIAFSLPMQAQKASKKTDRYLELVRSAYKGQNAYNTTAYVSELWRSPGNADFDSSIYYVQKILEKAGYQKESEAPNARLTYRLEHYPLRTPAWEPVDAKLSIAGAKTPLLQFRTNRNMIAINSFSTPSEGLEMEVVYLSSLEPEYLDSINLKGKIVLADYHPYSLFKVAVEKKGAIGILAYGIPDYNQPEKYQNSIPFTGIPFNSALKTWCINLSYAARTALHEQLEKGALKVKVEIDTKIYPSEELTLIAEVKGSKHPDQRFVYSAHVQEPGANDNASGVGAQAEMARVTAELFKEKAINPDRTLTFLWGVEIKSTNRYIQQDSLRATNIRWGMSLDMVGEDTEKTGGTFLIEKMPDPSAIWTRGDDKHSEWGASEVDERSFNPHYFNDFIEYVCRRQALTSNWKVNTNPFEGGSDHQPFLNANIPGLLLWHFTDVFYHTDADRIDKVSATTLSNVGISALTSGLVLCNDSEKTAKDLLRMTEYAALKRIKIEGRLSRNNIQTKESTIEDEKIILRAWKDWYLAALPTVRDVLSKDASRRLKRKIKRSLKRMKKASLVEMEQL